MKIVWSPSAIRHLIAIRAFIAEDSPGSVRAVANRLITSVDQLSRHPSSGRAGRVPGTREFVVPGTPYVLPYRVKDDRLEIIAVFHGRQRWPESF